MAGAQLGRDRGEAGFQLLDADIADVVVEQPLQAFAADEPGADVEIHEPEHAALGQRAGEGLKRVELAGGVAAADDGADGGADDDVRLEPAFSSALMTPI